MYQPLCIQFGESQLRQHTGLLFGSCHLRWRHIQLYHWTIPTRGTTPYSKDGGKAEWEWEGMCANCQPASRDWYMYYMYQSHKGGWQTLLLIPPPSPHPPSLHYSIPSLLAYPLLFPHTPAHSIHQPLEQGQGSAAVHRHCLYQWTLPKKLGIKCDTSNC